VEVLMGRYRVHRFEVKTMRDEASLEQFLNGITGDIISIVPHVAVKAFWIHRIDCLYVVEKVG
jgi:hypothetical protein